MSDIIELTDWLKAQPEFETKKRMLVFTDVIHTPSGRKVVDGYRYFRGEPDELIAAFDEGDIDAIRELEFALDEDGDADTSAVCLLLAYTDGGDFLAAQPQVYVDYEPTLVREPKYLAVADVRTVVEHLDQTA